jgi:methionine-rich copper-binding protein CopC
MMVRLSAAALLAAAAVLSGGTLGAGTAWADGHLAGANPADGAALPTAPSTVDLEFSATPDPQDSHMAVWSRARGSVTVGELRGTARDLVQPVRIGAAGDYTVVFHVVFADGSDLVGEAFFSVGTGVAPVRPPAAAVAADEATVREHDHGVDPFSGVLLVLDVVVLLGVILLLLRRARRWTVAPDTQVRDGPQR